MSNRFQSQLPPLASLLISGSQVLSGQLRSSLEAFREFEIAADTAGYPSMSTLEMRIRQMQPSAVLLDVQSDWQLARGLIEAIGHTGQCPQIVAFGDHADREVVLEALRAGACDFLKLPADAATQRTIAERVRQRLRVTGRVDRPSGRAVVFSSVKPGAGATTLAMQFAFAMRRLTGRRVLLADLDLEAGSIGFSLKLSPTASVQDALRLSDRLDAALWSSLVCPAYGVDVLCSGGANAAESDDWVRLQELIEAARAAYDWIIIDSPIVFHRLALLCLAHADDPILVSTPDLASLHMGRRALNHLGRIGLRQKHLRLILNRWTKQEAISSADLESIFGCPVSSFLQEDAFAVHRSLARAEPLGTDNGLARQIEKLCGAVSSPAGAVSIVS